MALSVVCIKPLVRVSRIPPFTTAYVGVLDYICSDITTLMRFATRYHSARVRGLPQIKAK